MVLRLPEADVDGLRANYLADPNALVAWDAAIADNPAFDDGGRRIYDYTTVQASFTTKLNATHGITLAGAAAAACIAQNNAINATIANADAVRAAAVTAAVAHALTVAVAVPAGAGPTTAPVVLKTGPEPDAGALI